MAVLHNRHIRNRPQKTCAGLANARLFIAALYVFKMINCPNCNTNGISRKHLILQELTISGFRAVCENCGTHVGVKQDGWILSFLGLIGTS